MYKAAFLSQKKGDFGAKVWDCKPFFFIKLKFTKKQ